MCRFPVFRNPPNVACPDGLTQVFLQQCFRHHPRASLLDPAVCPSGEELRALLIAHLSCFFGAQLLCSSHELLAKCFYSAALGSQLGCLALWSDKEKLFLLQDGELQRPGMEFCRELSLSESVWTVLGGGASPPRPWAEAPSVLPPRCLAEH